MFTHRRQASSPSSLFGFGGKTSSPKEVAEAPVVNLGRETGGHALEVARGWMYKWRGKFPRRWEWRLFILLKGGPIRYYRSGGGGQLELRGEIELATLEWLPRLPAEEWNKDVDLHMRNGTTLVLQGVQSNKTRRKRVWILRCTSVEAKQDWMKTINDAVNAVLQRGTPSEPKATAASIPSSEGGAGGFSKAASTGTSPRASQDGAEPNTPQFLQDLSPELLHRALDRGSSPGSVCGHSRTSSISSVASLDSLLEEAVTSLNFSDPHSVESRRKRASWSGRTEAGVPTQLQAAWNLPLQQDKVVKCGWLLKLKDPPVKRWQRRLFVIRTDFVVKYYAEDEKTGTLVEQGELDVDGLEFVEEEATGTGADLTLTFEAFQRNKSRRRRFSVRACAELALCDPLVEIVEWRRALEKEQQVAADPTMASTRRDLLLKEATKGRHTRHKKALSFDGFGSALDAVGGGGGLDVRPFAAVGSSRGEQLEDYAQGCPSGIPVRASKKGAAHARRMSHRRTLSEINESTFESLTEEVTESGSFVKLAANHNHGHGGHTRSPSSEGLFKLTSHYSLEDTLSERRTRAGRLRNQLHRLAQLSPTATGKLVGGAEECGTPEVVFADEVDGESTHRSSRVRTSLFAEAITPQEATAGESTPAETEPSSARSAHSAEEALMAL